jgi:hypothetical protein
MKRTVVALSAVIVGIAAVVLVVRVTVVTPQSVQKVTPIPEKEYDPAVWGRLYPLEYKSFRRNLEMSSSPTGYGSSINRQKPEKEPEILVNVLQKRLLFLLIVQIVKESTSAVFVIMAIDAEVFPVRAVRRIVFGIPILVMYGEKMAVFLVELTCTFRTNEPVNPQRLFPVALFCVRSHLTQQFIHRFCAFHLAAPSPFYDPVTFVSPHSYLHARTSFSSFNGFNG